jgi:hypothetical protein
MVRRLTYVSVSVIIVAACLVASRAGGTAAAAPALLKNVGAQLPDPSISYPPNAPLTAATPTAACAWSPTPTVKHIAPCGSDNGTGDSTSPWKTLGKALRELQAGQVAYVHADADPSKPDYVESDIETRHAGAAGQPTNFIRLTAAPGEEPVLRGDPATPEKALLRLTKRYWLVEGLRIDATGVRKRPVVLVGRDSGDVSDHGDHIALRRLTITWGGSANAGITFAGASHASLLDSILYEPIDPQTKRPVTVPTNKDDHHGVAIVSGSNHVLLRGNDSYGHNGDSAQCGEAPGPVPTDITIQNNRYHSDEENAVDIKHCQRLTIESNKFHDYRPARPAGSDRAPQGDAVVIHSRPGPTSAAALGADNVLLQLNRLFRNSRGINLSPEAGAVVIRRNLIFQGRTDFGGLGGGIRAAAKTVEIYHNTLDDLPGRLGADGQIDPNGAAVRLNDQGATQHAVLLNNIASNAPRLGLWVRKTPTSLGSLSMDRNLFYNAPWQLHGGVSAPARSEFGNPQYVATPADNDYFTLPGSPVRDSAEPLPSDVGDPVGPYCPANNPKPDLGFLESCF